MPERSPFEDLARGALLEITPASTVGEYVGTTDEGDGVVSVLFASAQPGYPDWRWTVSIAQVEGEEPTVLEAELMPAEGALLAPDWVPWSDRLADYKAAQENAEHPDSDDDDSDDDDDDSDDDDDDDDADEELDEDDVLGNDVLHGGDLDGVDIDDPDDADDDEDDEDDDDFDDPDDGEEVDRTY
jgi:hypothetical protein